MSKTLIFVTLAGLALVSAFVARPTVDATRAPDQVNQPLFKEFTDPYSARSLEVKSYDPNLDSLQDFQVALKDGQWVIPSHEDYPADAEDNLKNAATLLVDLKVISVAGDRKEDHKEFGVVEPQEDASAALESGTGKLISFRGEQAKRLAELIVGKEVRGSSDQHYVRVPGKDQVYVVKIDPNKISTRFQDWIQQDLLELNAFDIEEMELRDYSSNPVMSPQGLMLSPEERFQITTRWNEKEFKWDLKELREFQGREYVARELLEDEELDRNHLDEMKNALDDLKIVDVHRKPAGLRPVSGDEPPIWDNQEALMSLVDHGFYPDRNEDGSLKLYCSDGEVEIRTKEGISYTLWFGKQVATVDSKGTSQLNRYVMVSAKPNEAAFEKPKLELPPDLATEEKAASSTAEEAPAATTETPLADGTEAEKKEQPAADTERDKIVKEYERKMEEYKEKVKKAEEKARALNDRLGEWYYVVAEDVYDRIHLGRNKVIKTKEASRKEATDVEAFRDLEQKGIEDFSQPQGATQP